MLFLMRKFLILIVFVCCSAALYGQVDTVRLGYSVQGNVVDAVSGRPMESPSNRTSPYRKSSSRTSATGPSGRRPSEPRSAYASRRNPCR